MTISTVAQLLTAHSIKKHAEIRTDATNLQAEPVCC